MKSVDKSCFEMIFGIVSPEPGELSNSSVYRFAFVTTSLIDCSTTTRLFIQDEVLHLAPQRSISNKRQYNNISECCTK